VPSYDPSVFNVDGIDRAKWIILNPDGVHTPEERWVVETDYILARMAEWMPLKDAVVLDWGCGIGRLVKPLIERHGAVALGTDISSSMRSLAVDYVKSPNFLSCDPSAMPTLLKLGMQFDVALAVWSLQHVADPEADIEVIKSALNPGGRLFVLNADVRFVPTSENGKFGWADDGKNVWALLDRAFVALRGEIVDPKIVPAPLARWAIYERGVA
jgi:2-polyprenyl-3-methyl-5-hydroxy-6-metoxy-1,4-benzoquinol methylase